MRRRRAAWVGVIVAMAVVATGCGGGQSPDDALGRGRPETASPNEPIQVLLRERGARLLAGDVAGYLAALGPEARAFEEPIAQVAVTLPLNRIDMTINEANISDDGSKFRQASVWMTYSFKELPADNLFRVRFLYDIDRQPDRSWVIIKSKFDDRPLVPPPPPLWPRGPVEITRSPHFLVMARPGVPKVAEATALAEKGYAQLLPKLPLETDERALLVLAKDTEEFLANSGSKGARAQQQDVCKDFGGGLCRQEERLVFADLPLVLAADPLQSNSSPEGVLQHELAHLALSRFTRSCTNKWVVEGAAVHLGDQRRISDWEDAVADDSLDELSLNPPDPDDLDYGFAHAAVLHLVENHGAEKFFDFYQNFKSLPAGGSCAGVVTDVRSRLDERLLRRYYRFGVENLEGFAREYIRKAVAGS